jgi:hypothetical protein
MGLLVNNMDVLPIPKMEELQSSDATRIPEKMDRPHDLLLWLSQSFGFQVPITNEHHHSDLIF